MKRNIINYKYYLTQKLEHVARMSSNERDMYQKIICKFLLSLPRQEQEEPNRLSYHIEKAFYYYLDEVIKVKPTKDWDKQRNQFLYKLKQFTPSCLKINPQLLLVKLQQNKPVCGALIFNKDHTKVLTIKVKDRFGFPKGKWNQNEEAQHCAAREVFEETGISISDKIDSKIRIQFQTHGSKTFFFVARGISQVQRIKIDHKQIDQIIWMKLEDIRKSINQFVQRSRIAWNAYEERYYKADYHELATKYWKKDSEPFDLSVNPLLNFKLDKGRVYNTIYAAYR